MKEIVDLLKSEIEYFKKLKSAIGDIHGHIHSLAVKAAKIYLAERHPKVLGWGLLNTEGAEEKLSGNLGIVDKATLYICLTY